MEKDYSKKEQTIKASVEDVPGNDDDNFKMPNKKSKSKTPVLDTYSRDLTAMAEEGKLDQIVGRQKEIERVSQILSRRKKNNPILIGEPGCVDGDTLITVKKVSNEKSHNVIT